MAVWQRKRTGAGLTGLVHHLRPRRVSTGLFATGRPCPSARQSPRWGRRATPMTTPWPRRSSSLYKAELIRNQGPWEDIDVARARHRRVGALGGHHPTILRHRYASPCRARSRLGTRPPPPGTITTGNHRHQINQPPQNPGLDNQAPDTVLGEPLQGTCGQARCPWRSGYGPLAAGPQPVAHLEIGELTRPRAGGQGGQPVAPDVLEAQLGSLVGPLSAHG